MAPPAPPAPPASPVVRSSALGLFVAAALSLSAIVRAQPAAEPYWAAISAGEAIIRSGDSDRFYPVARIKPGVLLRVDAESGGWSRVSYPPGLSVFVAADAVKPEPGGKAVRVVRPTHPRAAKLDAAQALGSWKPALGQPLAAGTVLTLESPAPLADAGGKTSYRVRAPEQCAGFVQTAALARATPEQIAAYTSGLRQQGVTVAGLDTAAGADAGGPAVASGDTPAVPAEPIKPREPSIAERLEASFVAVRQQPPLEAEVSELIAEYEKAIAGMEDSPLTNRTKAQMRQRLEYLRVQQKLQAEVRAIEASKPKVGEEVARAADRLKDVESSRIYTVVGRLSASTLYDGKRLPLMYRIQSVGGPLARSLAYIKPSDELKLEAKIGQVVGIIGDSSIDSTLKLTIIVPRRVDVLTPEPAAPAAPAGDESSPPPAADGG